MGFYLNDNGSTTPTWYAEFSVTDKPAIPDAIV